MGTTQSTVFGRCAIGHHPVAVAILVPRARCKCTFAHRGLCELATLVQPSPHTGHRVPQELCNALGPPWGVEARWHSPLLTDSSPSVLRQCRDRVQASTRTPAAAATTAPRPAPVARSLRRLAEESSRGPQTLAEASHNALLAAHVTVVSSSHRSSKVASASAKAEQAQKRSSSSARRSDGFF